MQENKRTAVQNVSSAKEVNYHDPWNTYENGMFFSIALLVRK